MSAQSRELIGKDLREPERGRWPDNGRVEVVTDPNWRMPDGSFRIVRRVGWRRCLVTGHRFFSEEISRQRICKMHKIMLGVKYPQGASSNDEE